MMPLCTLCKGIPPLEDLHENHHGIFTHRTYQELKNLSTVNLCDLCSMIWNSLDGLSSTEKIMAEEPHRISVILEYHGSTNWDHISLSPNVPRDAGSMLELFIKRGEKSQKTITKKELAPSHDLPQTYEFIREATRECLNNHKQCSQNTHVEMPTFLVDVGKAHNEENVRVVRNDETCRGTYLAMSYCWGGPQRVMLTTKTLRSFQDKLPIGSLPEGLRDAVRITRRLGHRYIWIDALCIIQDDDDFKQVELRRMNRIYQNALLTIQPTNSDSVEKGFLDKRIITPFVKMILRQDTNGTQVYVYARPVMSPLGSAVLGPTTKRAWIFQETALSTRLVAFSSRQVIVACRTHSHKEDGTISPISLVGPGMQKSIRPDLYTATSPFGLEESRKVSLSGWYTTVGIHYTGRLYSVGKDRLYALSAFAEEAHKLIGGDYLAGVWSTDLIHGLNWSAKTWKLLNKTTEYRAPSWSWAAYDGQVLWNKERKHIEATTKGTKVVEAWVKPEGINPYGPCRDGKIVLEALVGAASVSTKPVYKGVPIYKGQFIMTTMNGTQDVCHGHFETEEEQPQFFTCVFLTSQKGLLLVPQDSSFRRIGRFALGNDYIRTGGTQGFQTWRDSCEYQTIAIV